MKSSREIPVMLVDEENSATVIVNVVGAAEGIDVGRTGWRVG